MSEPSPTAPSGSARSGGAHVAEAPSFWKRVLPQTILGLASLLFFMSIAAAFSGAALFAYYRFELDENGQPSVGAAFVLFSDSERSFLLTSYTTVRAATVDPGPAVTVRSAGQEIAVQLNSWDPGRDLALLVAEDNPNLPAIEIADPSSVSIGDRAFAVSGLGGDGASIVQGTIIDVAGNAISHDVPIGPQFQGGPLLSSSGQLIAISSRTYAPLGFPPDATFFGVPVREACAEVVQCPAEVTG